MKSIKFFLGLCAIALMTVACDEATVPVTPPTPGGGSDSTAYTGTGTKSDPYTVGDVIKINPQSTTAAAKTNVWVSGYIVGYYDNNNNPATLETSATEATVNIMLCETATGATLSNTVCVQLPAGAICDSLNIYSNPDLLSKEVLVYGDLMLYNTLPGVRNTSGYWLVEENIGINPPETGSFDVPEMTIAELKALYTTSGSTVTISEEKKIVGVVVTSLAGGNSTSLKNLVIVNPDNTVGIAVRFSGKDNEYAMNQKIEILVNGATLSEYAGALQLGVAEIRTQAVGTATITPNVVVLPTLIADFDTYAFTVVQTEGTITSGSTSDLWGSSSAHVTHELVSGSSSIALFISKYSTFVQSALPTGLQFVTGILQNYNTTYQIIIRDLNDVTPAND